MPERAEPTPGRPRKELRGEIIELLGPPADHRAMTLGSITDHVDGSRRTVKDRLDRLVAEGTVDCEKIGNATAYWIEDAPTPSLAGEPMASGGMVTVAPANPAGYASSVGPIYFEDRFGLLKKLNLLMVVSLSIASLVSFGGWVATSSGELLIIALLTSTLAALGAVALFIQHFYNSRVFDRLGGWAQLRIKRLRRSFK